MGPRSGQVAGPQPLAEGTAGSGGFSQSLWLGRGTRPSPHLGVSLINLLIFLVSGGCLLSSEEKDVKLIPTLIKAASRLNMYEHILIWGLHRKEY